MLTLIVVAGTTSEAAAQAPRQGVLGGGTSPRRPLTIELESRTDFGAAPLFEPLSLDSDVDTVQGEDVVAEEVYGVGGFGAFHHSDPCNEICDEMRLHHSSTDGRFYGPTPPIEGTSWLNRPYYVTLSSGGFFMTQGVQRNVRNDNDLFGAVHMGWDWDYFWGLEFRIGRASPEMINKTQPTAARNDALLITDLSLMYYPAGDTLVRPFLRAGIGWTDIDFPNDSGTRTEASPFTMPLGFGVKWPVRRWLGARVEFTDNLAFGDSAINTQHNLTLVLGLEYRFGAKPKSYWPWNPERHLQ